MSKLIWSIFAIFTACECGERLTNAFDQIGRVTDILHWYNFPHHMRKMMLIFVIAAQQPFEASVFGSIACGRATFKDVCRFY